METAKERFREGIESVEREGGIKVTCLLTDAFLWFSGELAVEMGVAWVPYWTAAACSLSTHLNTDLIRETLGFNGTIKDVNQTLSFLPGFSSIPAKHIPEGIIHGDFESPIAKLVHKMGQHLPKAKVVVVNSFEELEPEITKDLKSKLLKVLHVGPSTLPSQKNMNMDPNGCLSWLETQSLSSVTYISFGTITTPPPHELLALTEALLDKKTPFLWSMRDHAIGLLPKGFVEETKDFGKIVLWAPQVDVLTHPSVGVFVTHCGWNSIFETITGGVPVICRPFFGDQNINSLMVQDVWKIGIRVEGGVFTRNGTIKALESVLSSEGGKRIRKNVIIIKEKAKQAIGSNGTSATNFTTLIEIIKKSEHS